MNLNEIEAQGAEDCRLGRLIDDNPHYIYEAINAWRRGFNMEKQRQEMQKLADEEE